jgi:hypothetical protein
VGAPRNVLYFFVAANRGASHKTPSKKLSAEGRPPLSLYRRFFFFFGGGGGGFVAAIAAAPSGVAATGIGISF